MGRLACLSLPALPLQLLLRQHPEWKGRPVAVVAEEKPQGRVLWVNRATARAGVQPGWRYGAASSLIGDLRVGVVPAQALAAEVAQLAERLQRLTPHVEPSPTQPGVFWLDAAGLRRVAPSLEAWGRAVLAAARDAGWTGAVVVGFTRFGTWAAAVEAVGRGRRGVTVFPDARAERAAARDARLALVAGLATPAGAAAGRTAGQAAARSAAGHGAAGLTADALERLEQLGVRTVGAFADLPEAGILERFGPEAHRLHRLARGTLQGGTAGGGFDPALEPAPLREPVAVTVPLDYPEADRAALLFLVKSRLHPLLGLLAARRQGLAELEVRLDLDGGGQREERVRPAAPTLDLALVVDLVRLRLEAVTLEQGVVAVGLVALGGPAPPEQMRLFAEHPRRDLRAGEQALARLRAEFGTGAVARAELREGHLPEAQFAWVPLERMAFPTRPERGTGAAPAPASAPGSQPAAGSGERSLVRRLYGKPVALPALDPDARDGTFVNGQVRGPLARRLGPYVLSGGWWVREVRRDYYFAETVHGELLWLYHDRKRRRWFLQGRVE
jgi:protein ImuB